MGEEDSPIIGLHLEGPYINKVMAGGQIPEYIKNPDPDDYIPLLEGTSCIKRCDVAPELPGALEFGKYASSKGILMAIAHTEAEYDLVKAAYDSGYTHVLCEKPLASNAREARAMIAASQQYNVTLMEAMKPTLTPNFHALQIKTTT